MTLLLRLRRWFRRRQDRQLSPDWWKEQHRRSTRVTFEGPPWNWSQFLHDQKAREARGE